MPVVRDKFGNLFFDPGPGVTANRPSNRSTGIGSTMPTDTPGSPLLAGDPLAGPAILPEPPVDVGGIFVPPEVATAGTQPFTPPAPQRTILGVQNLGNGTALVRYSDGTQAVQDIRTPEQKALLEAQIESTRALTQQRLGGGAGGAGRTQFASEAERDLAAAALARAQAGNLTDRLAFDQGRALGSIGGQQTLEAELGRGRLDLDRMQTENQLRIAYQRLGLDEREAARRAQLDADRLSLEQELGRGRLGIDQQRLGLEQQLGLGRLGIDEQRLGLEERALEQRGAESAADRALREAMALGRVGGQDTLERELGMGRLGLDQQRLGLEEQLGLERLGLDRARTFGFDERGMPTVEAGRLLGRIGNEATLENVFGRADRLGLLDGQSTLAGRQQQLAEDEAAFRRLSTPSAAGALLGLQQQGLVPATALQTGSIGGLSARAPQRGMAAPATAGLPQAQPVGSFTPASRSVMPAQPGALAPAPRVNERLGGRQTPALGGFSFTPSNRTALGSLGAPTAAPTGQQTDLSRLSLQQFNRLGSRETQALGGFMGTQGLAIQDVGERAQKELQPLGSGLQRRSTARLGMVA